ncbi:peptidylprolyl isomerase [Acutalibacter muris]|uniref:Peptidylprolyl isomerase n=1 Tax=Acutalibacter muris TaxID=1796620 RepID=A0A1Z2XWD2_9FIRM|nr:hypothetical protein [Acutalibacter muris]ANU56131.1 hypothetical protein A4V00_17110 [Hungateiclostridiaceae bacterium KB18]ASB42742.1 hypothetical protein ADH66_11200 [Acutalibacter muris]QQR31957.1 peptidylprolyl isomerase [Acutalibacter muris]
MYYLCGCSRISSFFNSLILVGGQSYKLGSRSLTRADLGLLRQMRNELLAQENTGDGGLLPGTVAAFFEGR